jgi:hypothetical protein
MRLKEGKNKEVSQKQAYRHLPFELLGFRRHLTIPLLPAGPQSQN